MYKAISQRNSSVVDLLLQNGARADAQISHLFNCYEYWFKPCTWITISVICGAASCVDVLIQHGANITALDGAGRSTIQLAKDFAFGPHPRAVKFLYQLEGEDVEAEEDTKTLAVVERAFHLRFQGTKSLEDYIDPKEPTSQHPSRRDRLILVLQTALEKALGIVLTPSQITLFRDHLEDLYYYIRPLWKLSFYEALLMRFIYLLSYAVLLAVEMRAFIIGRKRVPMPSRFLLSSVAFLALALIWGSSTLGLS